MKPVKREAAEHLRAFVLEHAMNQMNCTGFASQSLCEGTMSAKSGMAVAMSAFGNARHAENIVSLINPMAPKRLEAIDLE